MTLIKAEDADPNWLKDLDLSHLEGRRTFGEEEDEEE